MKKLSQEEITAALSGLEGWKQEGNSLVRSFNTKGFPQTVGLAASIGVLCQQHDHHPDYLTIRYASVELSFSTHSEGGITQKDIDIAKDINAL